MERHVADGQYDHLPPSEHSGTKGSEDDADLAKLDGVVRGEDGRLRAKMARHANGGRLFEEGEDYPSFPTFIPL